MVIEVPELSDIWEVSELFLECPDADAPLSELSDLASDSKRRFASSSLANSASSAPEAELSLLLLLHGELSSLMAVGGIVV